MICHDCTPLPFGVPGIRTNIHCSSIKFTISFSVDAYSHVDLESVLIFGSVARGETIEKSSATLFVVPMKGFTLPKRFSSKACHDPTRGGGAPRTKDGLGE